MTLKNRLRLMRLFNAIFKSFINKNVEDRIMKTKFNLWKSLMLAVLATAPFLSGSIMSAQSDPDEPVMDEMNTVISGLESLMITFEESLKYVAPSGDYEEVALAMERLEALADKIENELMYHAADFESLPDQYTGNSVSPEWLTEKSDLESKTSPFKN